MQKTKDAANDKLRRAGKALHDDVGPLLAAAGLRLQLLRMDHPQAAEQVNELLGTLDDAMERGGRGATPYPWLADDRASTGHDHLSFHRR